MQRILLKSKIHGATLTGKELQYEGSIALDQNLITAANLMPGEQVHVLNLNNGERLVTYVIKAPAGSGTVMLNGPAARLGEPGDTVIVLSYALAADDEAKQFKPVIVRVDGKNHPFTATGFRKKRTR